MTVPVQVVVVLMFGSFVLGGGLTALSFERLRSRVARMADDLDHMRWALEDLHQEGQLRADPPGDRWARLKRAGALAPAAPAPLPPQPEPDEVEPQGPVEEPVLVPAAAGGRFARIRAHWQADEGRHARGLADVEPARVWTDSPLVAGPGWLPAAWAQVCRPAVWAGRHAARAGRVAARRMGDGLMEVLLTGAAAGLAVGRWLVRRLAPLARVLEWLGLWWSGQAPHVEPYFGPLAAAWSTRSRHQLRRGRKPYERFVNDRRDRDLLDAARVAQLDVWLAFEKPVPARALSEEEQEAAFEQSLAELYARAQLVRSS